jgi:SAM-dependent methyltransferase
VLEPHKQAEIESYGGQLPERAYRKPFGQPWEPAYFVKWATIWHAFRELGVPVGTRVLDVGAGFGWTSAFLAESGFQTTALDIAPGTTEVAKARAERCGLEVETVVADMDDFNLGRSFGAALVFDALHHSIRPRAVVERIAQHLAPGGWVLFGEPSLLHYISPGAWRQRQETGWIERGVSVRRLSRYCRSAGLGEFRRFFEGSGPYESRIGGFAWQLLRLCADNVAFAPKASIWLAARRSGHLTIR